MVCKNIVAIFVIAICLGFGSNAIGQDEGDDTNKRETQAQKANDKDVKDPDDLGETNMRAFGIAEGGGRAVSPRKRHIPKKKNRSAGNHDLEEDVFFGDDAITVTDRQGRRSIKIIHNDEIGIYIEVVNTYGPEDTKQLIERHPELADYIELFPKQIGDNEIGLNISVKSKYAANTVEELQKNHAAGFNLYRRYYKKPKDTVRKK